MLIELLPHPPLQVQPQLAAVVPAPVPVEAPPSVAALTVPLKAASPLLAPPVVPLVKHEPRKTQAAPWRIRDAAGDPGLRKSSGSIGMVRP